jgi:hypothetical protein
LWRGKAALRLRHDGYADHEAMSIHGLVRFFIMED